MKQRLIATVKSITEYTHIHVHPKAKKGDLKHNKLKKYNTNEKAEKYYTNKGTN